MEVTAASSSSGVPASIRAWAARPGAVALLTTARSRLETGRAGDRTRVPVEAAHRADVGRLLGVAWELSGRDVTVKALRDALTRAGTSLEDVLVDAGGPRRVFQLVDVRTLEVRHWAENASAVKPLRRWAGPQWGETTVRLR